MSFEQLWEESTVKDVSEYLMNFPSRSEKTSELSIHEVPNFIKEVQPKAFEPMVVSIGPYHHGKPHLSLMELPKLKLFHQFINTRRLKVEFVVESVMNLLEELRGSYNMICDGSKEEIESLLHFMIWDKSKQGTDKLLKLMILDGCFVIEFLNNCPPWLKNMRSEIKRDMLMLENQLPMKLLDTLCSMAPHTNRIDLRTVQLHFSHQAQCISEDVEARQYLHILDMYREVLLYPRSNSDGDIPFESQFDPEHQIIRHATQLREAGIRFERSKTESYIDMSFEGSTLRLPCVVLDDGTESALLNVMAFEKLHIGTDHKVTSFIAFMDDLIDEDRDVALLASGGVVVNALGDDRAAANLFNLLAKGITTNSTHFARVNKMVNEHCKKPWNEWSASLKHTYFQNPWTIISVLAAIFAFAILILQAIYQICDYYGVSPGN